MSYRKKYIKAKIDRLKPKESILKKLWFWVGFLILLVICTGAYFFFFYPGFQLKNIIVSGNRDVKTQDLQSIVSEDATTGLVNFWGLKIVSRSTFLINSEKINNTILEKFPQIERLTISKKLPQTLTLSVTERKSIGFFCPLVSLAQTNNNCFSIDANGTVFGLPGTPPASTTIIRSVAVSGQISAGQVLIEQNIMSIIYKIQKDLADNFQIGLKEIVVVNSTRLNVTTNEGWQIYFDLSSGSNIDSQLIKLNLLLSKQILTGSEASPGLYLRKNLKYIDLRPNSRAIICDNSTCGS